MFYGNPTSTSGNNLYGNVSISSGQNTGWYDLEVYNQNTGNFKGLFAFAYVVKNHIRSGAGSWKTKYN